MVCAVSASLEQYLRLLLQKKTSQGMVTLITYFLEIILHSTDIILVLPMAESEENTLGYIASFFHALTVFREEELPMPTF